MIANDKPSSLDEIKSAILKMLNQDAPVTDNARSDAPLELDDVIRSDMKQESDPQHHTDPAGAPISSSDQHAPIHNDFAMSAPVFGPEASEPPQTPSVFTSKRDHDHYPQASEDQHNSPHDDANLANEAFSGDRHDRQHGERPLYPTGATYTHDEHEGHTQPGLQQEHAPMASSDGHAEEPLHLDSVITENNESDADVIASDPFFASHGQHSYPNDRPDIQSGDQHNPRGLDDSSQYDNPEQHPDGTHDYVADQPRQDTSSRKPMSQDSVNSIFDEPQSEAFHETVSAAAEPHHDEVNIPASPIEQSDYATSYDDPSIEEQTLPPSAAPNESTYASASSLTSRLHETSTLSEETVLATTKSLETLAALKKDQVAAEKELTPSNIETDPAPADDASSAAAEIIDPNLLLQGKNDDAGAAALSGPLDDFVRLTLRTAIQDWVKNNMPAIVKQMQEKPPQK